MRKFALVIVLISSILMLTGAFSQRHALACEMLPILNYQRIGSDVFLRADIESERAERIREIVGSASERIEQVYGSPTSTPRMLITSNLQLAEKWGANATASMHRLPWRSCIVIGPDGENVDVIAHEWLHAEIQYRVGFIRFLDEIPVWFDEGAALTVDYRAPFLPENIDVSNAEIQNVKRLVRGKSFFSGDIKSNYQAARLAVEPLIFEDRFFDDLERISLGESFDNVFVSNKFMLPMVNATTD